MVFTLYYQKATIGRPSSRSFLRSNVHTLSKTYLYRPCYRCGDHRKRTIDVHAASDAFAAGGGGGADESSGSPQKTQIFPRIRETDPYRLLGLTPEATFEEIQDARNFYYDTYRDHDPSREAIELAFDAVLEECIQKRKKFGFQPPKLGKRTGPAADPPRRSIMARIRDIFEPAVPLTTIVNDGVIYLLLSFWAAGTQYATADPTGPFVVAMGFCAWRLFDKRQKRNPDGPFFGGSAIWGALGNTLLAFVFASLLAIVIIPAIPWSEGFPSDAVGAGLAIVVVGITSIFVR